MAKKRKQETVQVVIEFSVSSRMITIDMPEDKAKEFCAAVKKRRVDFCDAPWDWDDFMGIIEGEIEYAEILNP